MRLVTSFDNLLELWGRWLGAGLGTAFAPFARSSSILKSKSDKWYFNEREFPLIQLVYLRTLPYAIATVFALAIHFSATSSRAQSLADSCNVAFASGSEYAELSRAKTSISRVIQKSAAKVVLIGVDESGPPAETTGYIVKGLLAHNRVDFQKIVTIVGKQVRNQVSNRDEYVEWFEQKLSMDADREIIVAGADHLPLAIQIYLLRLLNRPGFERTEGPRLILILSPEYSRRINDGSFHPNFARFLLRELQAPSHSKIGAVFLDQVFSSSDQWASVTDPEQVPLIPEPLAPIHERVVPTNPTQLSAWFAHAHVALHGLRASQSLHGPKQRNESSVKAHGVVRPLHAPKPESVPYRETETPADLVANSPTPVAKKQKSGKDPKAKATVSSSADRAQNQPPPLRSEPVPRKVNDTMAALMARTEIYAELRLRLPAVDRFAQGDLTSLFDLKFLSLAAIYQALWAAPLNITGVGINHVNLAAAANTLGITEPALLHLVNHGTDSGQLTRYLIRLGEMKRSADPIDASYLSEQDRTYLRVPLPTLKRDDLLKISTRNFIEQTERPLLFRPRSDKRGFEEEYDWIYFALMLGLSEKKATIDRHFERMGLDLPQLLRDRQLLSSSLE